MIRCQTRYLISFVVPGDSPAQTDRYLIVEISQRGFDQNLEFTLLRNPPLTLLVIDFESVAVGFDTHRLTMDINAQLLALLLEIRFVPVFFFKFVSVSQLFPNNILRHNC